MMIIIIIIILLFDLNLLFIANGILGVIDSLPPSLICVIAAIVLGLVDLCIVKRSIN